LADVPEVVLPQRNSLDGVEHAWHLYQVRVPDRDRVGDAMREAGVGTSVHFIPAHRLSAYREIVGAEECERLPVTDRVAGELLALRLYPGLSADAQDRVVAALPEALRTRA